MTKLFLATFLIPAIVLAAPPQIEKIDLKERIQYLVQADGKILFQHCSPNSCTDLIPTPIKLADLVAQLEDDPPKMPMAAQILIDASVSQKVGSKARAGTVGFLVGKENEKAVSCWGDSLDKIIIEKKVGEFLQLPIKDFHCTNITGYVNGKFSPLGEQAQELTAKLKAANE